MAIAIFSNKVFEVNSDRKYTFSDLQSSSTLETEKQDSEGSKPSTYIKGPGLDNLNFKMKLDISDGINPRTEWESWINIKNNGVPYPFILGGKPVGGNNWLLVGVNQNNAIIDNEGRILEMDITLQFDEYVRPGKADFKNTAGSSPGLYDEIQKKLNIDTAPEDKASLKRDNERMANLYPAVMSLE